MDELLILNQAIGGRWLGGEYADDKTDKVKKLLISVYEYIHFLKRQASTAGSFNSDRTPAAPCVSVFFLLANADKVEIIEGEFRYVLPVDVATDSRRRRRRSLSGIPFVVYAGQLGVVCFLRSFLAFGIHSSPSKRKGALKSLASGSGG